MKHLYLLLALFTVLFIHSGNVFSQRTVDLNSYQDDFRVIGADNYDHSGYSVASGDINGDGFDDLIIGAPYADPSARSAAGEIYVILGSSGPGWGLRINDAGSREPELTILGGTADDYCGYAISSGDINGDGYDDVIVGAPDADPSGRSSAGKVYVIFGEENRFWSTLPDVDLNSSSADMEIYGATAGDMLGFSVASADVNGDGYSDIIIGAPEASPNGRSLAGETYVILGAATPPSVVNLNTTSADMTIKGNVSEYYTGTAVSGGDINGDSYDDVIIGAPDAEAFSREWPGTVFVVFGSSSPSATVDLLNAADLSVYGATHDYMGNSVASGDVNGDNYDDIIMGAPEATPDTRDLAGKTYVIFGDETANLPATIDLGSTAADITVLGDDTDDLSGEHVASGDVNGDGYADIIIGAAGGDPGLRNDAGETYVIFGATYPATTVDLSTTSASITILGENAGDNSGCAVASGDFDGSGGDDVFLGAENADGSTDVGETYIVLAEYVTVPVYKAFLEGAYNSTSNNMTTILQDNNYLPTNSPYSIAPRKITRVSGYISSNSITDWILVQLRSTDNGPAIDSKSAFILWNGRIVDDDPEAPMRMNAPEGDYYIVIKHRNHIEIMTTASVSLTKAWTFDYDFSGNINKYYGTGGAKELVSGIWGMWAGDINQDGQTTTADFTQWFNSARAGDSGYQTTDINLDSQVTTADFTKWFNNARAGASSAVP